MAMETLKTSLAQPFLVAIVGLLATLFFIACDRRPTGDTMAELRGLATYQERIGLPAKARLEVELMDVTKVNAATEILGRTVVENAGQKPIGFKLVYNRAHFEQGHIYAVKATIYNGRQILFSTPETYPLDLENLNGLLNIVLEKAN